MEKILIIDDNESLRYTLESVLEENGFLPTSAEDGVKALEEFKSKSYDLVICDMKMPKMDGMQILAEVKKIDPEMPFIILTAFGDIKNAVEAMKKGASDYLTKPFDNDGMILTLRKALEIRYLNKELAILRKRTDDSYKGEGIIGSSPQMKEVFDQVKIVAPTNLTVLIQGESGTGKEVIANMIHRASERAGKPFIAVDCGAIPESLIESELFGHEKGAFTDAKSQREGKFEQANGGTIFLDEITNLSDPNQIKLLRAIQERKITRIGGKKALSLDVRILTATNVKLAEAVNNNKFRADLYYRLNEFHIDLPPLRARTGDLTQLVDHFIKDANEELNKSVNSVSDEVMKKIKAHHWPGNVRELRNTIRRAVLLTPGNTMEKISITDDVAPKTVYENPAEESDNSSFETLTKKAEKDAILSALDESGGNKSKAAKLLNMNERTFYRKLKSLGIN
ncbi:MAG TPA: sigma-54 dependent transcriptional regulator [Ignavibacteria bacterium]|nr:sigma-54 dependent transcriptional regulator [Ignavibacteria bacterium]HRF65551.1 sigma-54 dependent transcriptional regulator [Ignavibacteria bacterium]HRJ02953.1 sigma-54 dependent transcriptional regulator [Ignavibacteria bacterium]